jgi:hypothetical protein
MEWELRGMGQHQRQATGRLNLNLAEPGLNWMARHREQPEDRQLLPGVRLQKGALGKGRMPKAGGQDGRGQGRTVRGIQTMADLGWSKVWGRREEDYTKGI